MRLSSSHPAAATLLAASLVLSAVPAHGQAKAPAGTSLRIPFERYTLPNGLTVILSEDHSTRW
jgi:hypothetical protein